ncbi:hypothetical protein IG631_23959 [Alternaria alternata]|nr:hypothetical protein IG631_23959 [Alternaria alternata]
MQGEYVMISKEVLSTSSISPCGPLNQPRGSEDMTQSNGNHSPSSAICKPSSVAHSPKEFAAIPDSQGINDNNKHLPEAQCGESRSDEPTVQQTKAVGSFTDKELSATSRLLPHGEPSLAGTENSRPYSSSSVSSLRRDMEKSPDICSSHLTHLYVENHSLSTKDIS